MAISYVEVDSVLDFLRKNGFSEAESALREEMEEKSGLGSFDMEKFFYPMVPPPPPVKIPTSIGGLEYLGYGGDGCRSSSVCSGDEFVSLVSSTSDVCSSEFVNPYGVRSTSRGNSQVSSDRLSQFGTARDYHDFDMQNDLFSYREKDDENFMTPSFKEPDFFSWLSEDKFVMSSPTEQYSNNNNPLTPDKPVVFSKGIDLSVFKLRDVRDVTAYCDASPQYNYSRNRPEGLKGFSNLYVKDVKQNGKDDYEIGDNGEVIENRHKNDDLLMCNTEDDKYEVFDLRIIHRKNRTGFEEHKDLLIALNSVIAGRYYVTEYLGSAAFSKVFQAHDLQLGLNVCLKIIKNNKDFMDQSLDEIKLLKLVNKHDPADRHHILRLYDYFYHREHLFIVCELLGMNLYEFQNFNKRSAENYFTLNRLQVITRQCLEALKYMHQLGIIHCDLKPENILMKSYRRCEIKVIDLGSSCFLSDSLGLYVQSRSYRAPEVILGLPYDQKIDIWSLGCIVAELCSGEVLFPNEAVVIILARMIGMLGPIDTRLLSKGQETHKYFTGEYDLYHVNEETDQLEYIIPEESSLEHHLQVNDTGFIDFVKHLLVVNHRKRPTAAEALDHPWLSRSFSTP